MFKVRYSWGKTGNDILKKDLRFPYLYTIETMMTDENEPKPTGGYQFADVGYDRYYGGMRY